MGVHAHRYMSFLTVTLTANLIGGCAFTNLPPALSVDNKAINDSTTLSGTEKSTFESAAKACGTTVTKNRIADSAMNYVSLVGSGLAFVSTGIALNDPDNKVAPWLTLGAGTVTLISQIVRATTVNPEKAVEASKNYQKGMSLIRSGNLSGGMTQEQKEKANEYFTGCQL